MHRALSELTIVGIETSREFHLRVMEDAEFQRGDIEIQWLERRLPELVGASASRAHIEAAAIAAALLADRDRRTQRGLPAPTATGASGDGAAKGAMGETGGLARRRRPVDHRRAPRGSALAVVATARIESIAAGGAGVSRVDGLVVFTPRTAPGDLVELSFIKRDRLGQGRLGRLLEPSPDRVEARCRHYERDRCGGCQLQHLDIEAQRDAKRRIVADAFTRIARRVVDVLPVVPSPEAWGYRNKLTLTLRWSDGAWRGGMHRWDDVDRLFTLEECPITHPRVVAGWRGVLQEGRLLPRARELRGAVRLAGEQLALQVEGGTHWPHAREFAALLSGFGAVRWIDAAGRTHDIAAHGAPRPTASFEQVNPALAERLHADVVTEVQALLPAFADGRCEGTVIDAYAGVGETAVALASRGAQVTAIELDGEAADHASRRLGPPSRVITARVEDVLASLLPAQAVILNPPRAGVDARVCAALEAQAASSGELAGVVYVSCNPATLARDVGRLPSFRVARVQPYDMFPQTAHVETLCLLVPER